MSQLVCFPSFYLFFFLYTGFSFTVACTHGFSWNSCVYTWFFCKQSCMPRFFPFWGRLSVVGWVWMIAESSWMLLESVYIPVSNQRHLVSLNFFKCSCHFIFYFCFGISALGLFYLSALLGCCLIVLPEFGGCRVIYLLFILFNSKIQKHFSSCIVIHCLHFALAWYFH